MNEDNVLSMAEAPIVYNEPVISGFPDRIKPDDNCPLKGVSNEKLGNTVSYDSCTGDDCHGDHNAAANHFPIGL